VETLADGSQIVGPELWAAAQTGDPRVVPIVARVLEQAEPPAGLGRVLLGIGEHTADLLDLIHRRMVELAGRSGAAEDDRVLDLAEALGNLGARAGTAADDLTALLVAGAAPNRIVPALGRIGPAAVAAAPFIRQYLDTRNGLGRIGAAEEVARAVLFLASDDAAFVSGHQLSVDGGLLAA